MSGARVLFVDRDGSPDRGTARRAGRPARQDPADARASSRRCSRCAPGSACHGHEPGRTRNAESADRGLRDARIGSCWSCSPRRASNSRRCSSARISCTRIARCRKPRLGMVEEYVRDASRSIRRAASWSATAIRTSISPRISAVTGLRVRLAAHRRRPGPPSPRACSARRGARASSGKTRETHVAVRGRPVARGTEPRRHRARILRPHARADRKARRFCARSSNAGAILHIDEHHTVEDCALALGAALREALGDKRGIGRYGFLLAMDEAEAQVALDLSGRPYFVWEGRFDRERVGEHADRAGAAFFSLAGATRSAPRCTFACAARTRTTWSNPASRESAAACGRRFAATAASCRAPRARL